MERKKLYEFSLFIFRRDHRIIDNTALINASKSSKKIIPAFFLDERQIDKKKNPYFSSNCVQFMIESLSDLNTQLSQKNSKLFLFHGDLNKNLINFLKSNPKIGAIYLNEDYTPFSIKRDEEIKKICTQEKLDFHSYEDLMLTNLHQVMTPKGDFFKVYTPYCQAAMNFPVKKPDLYNEITFAKEDEVNSGEIEESKPLKTISTENLFDLVQIKNNKNVEIKGGRTHGYEIVKNIKNFEDYGVTRMHVNLPSTRFSAYLKFGCVSIREVYDALLLNFGKNHDIVKQLQWRDFFMKITYFYPYVIGQSMKSECDFIKWQAKDEHIEAWKNGTTGFPIVDSSMRCLNETGYIHNKLRTMVCSFLVKDVLADWRIGEKYFANQLVDYDISLNNGGWQWTGSTGTDPRGEPRIYNPVMQSSKLDPDCDFILKWLPELKGVKKAHIHDWEKYNHIYEGEVNYPKPIFSHYKQSDIAKKMFRDCLYHKAPKQNKGNNGYDNSYKNGFNKDSNNKGKDYNKKYYSQNNYQNAEENYNYNYQEENSYVNDSKTFSNTYTDLNVESSYINYNENSNNADIINMYENFKKANGNGNKRKKNKNDAKNNNGVMSMIYGAKNIPSTSENLIESLKKK